MALSAYGEALALKFALQGDDTNRPSGNYGIGFAANSTSFQEATAIGYSRQPASFAPVTNNLATASGTYSFPGSPASYWAFGLFDSPTDGAGSVLFYGTSDYPVQRPGGVTMFNLECDIGAVASRNSVSSYLETLLLQYLCNGAGVAPTVCAVGISSELPIPESNISNEVIDAGYSRTVVNFVSGADGTFYNQDAITFGPFSNDVPVAGACIFDNTSAGHLMFGCEVADPQVYPAGTTMTFPPNHLWVSLI